MPRLILVDDPLYKGKPPVPQLARGQAMRRMYEQLSMSVGDIARHFGITYQLAYKQINPARLPAGAAASTMTKPLTPDRLSSLSKSRLVQIATAKTKDPTGLRRAEQAADELDRRYPTWVDEL